MMQIFCLEDFKREIQKLTKNNSYSSLEKDIINYFFNKTGEELNNGIILNASLTTPYIKKRLEGSGGFRVYFYLIIKNNCLYLLYIHPKSGKYGSSNVSNEAKKGLLKKVIAALKTDEFYVVTPDHTNIKLNFSKKLPENRF